ncbi:MAG: hypothetical protein ICV63_07090 [Coleofasciculus sp. Co-bin14]|nr:hypothetical protein [Coleofasciculus sp. Co-bin14]
MEVTGLDAGGLEAGDISAGVKAAGLAGLRLGIGDASVGLEATELDEEVGVSEVEDVGDELQPITTISKPARNH